MPLYRDRYAETRYRATLQAVAIRFGWADPTGSRLNNERERADGLLCSWLQAQPTRRYGEAARERF